MKKLLLVFTALALTLGLSACDMFGGGEDIDPEDVLTAITLSGIEDVEIEAETAFNALTGITAMGDDDVDYSEFISVDSEVCDIADDGTVDTDTAMTCVIDYTVVAGGKLARGSMTLTITPKEIIIDDAPLLIGWDFEEEADLEGWSIYVANGGAIDMSIEDGAMKLITESGGQRFETRLDYQGVALEQGYDYKVSFRAKSDIDGKKVHLNFGELLASDPWFTPFKPEGVHIITLSTEWQEFSYTFSMELDNQNGGPLFEMGNMEGSMDLDATIWVDDLKIEGGSGTDTAAPVISGPVDQIIEVGATFDPLAGVTANDFVDGDLTADIDVTGTVDTSTAGDYDLTYTVSDAAGNETTVTITITVVGLVADPNNTGVNDIFASDTTITDDETADWYTTIVWGEPIFTAEIVSGQLVLTSARDGDKDYGTNFWDHIVRYQGLRLISGAEYKINFDAMTDETGNTTDNMMIKIETADGFFTEATKAVGDTMGTYSHTFTYTGETTTAGYLLFFVGGREHVITIENIEVMIGTDFAGMDNAPTLVVPDDAVLNPGDAFDPLEGASASDIEDGDLTDDIVVTVLGPNDETVLDTNVEGTWTVTYTVTDSGGNEVTETVLVNVAAMVFNPTDLVANGEFDASGWYTWVDVWSYSGSMAEAYLMVVNGDTDPEMMIDIVQAGSAGWAIQMTQDLTLEAGKQYQVSFDAYADAARNINAVTGYSDAGNNWVEFGGNTDMAITDTKTTYTYVLTATDPGDFQVQLKFEVGGDANNVYIDNVKVEEYDGAAVVADTDLAVNGTFDAGDNLAGWSSWSRDWDPVITSSIKEAWNELVFTYDGVGDARWNNQINYEGIEFEYGKTYRLVFDAKGDAARDFLVNIYDGSAGLESDVLALTTEFQTFEHIFTYTLGATAKIEIQLGAFDNSAGSMFYLDNVKVEELDMEPVLLNGMFEDNNLWTSWSADWLGLSGSTSIVDQALLFTYGGGVGEAPWNHQLNFEGLTFTPGTEYKVTFKAKGDVARDFIVNVWDADNSIGHDSDPFTLGTDWATYEYVFTYDAAADDSAKLELQFGLVTSGDAGTMFYLDDVVLTEWDSVNSVAVGDNMVTNGTFDQALEWNQWIDPEGWSGAATEAYLTVVDGELVFDIVQAGGAGWAIQLIQGVELQEGITYHVQFDAYADAARTINAVVGYEDAANNNAWVEWAGFSATTTPLSITDTLTTYSFSFTAGDAMGNSVVFKIEAGGDLNNVYIDNVYFFPVYN